VEALRLFFILLKMSMFDVDKFTRFKEKMCHLVAFDLEQAIQLLYPGFEIFIWKLIVFVIKC
jgi:hypothetical protein